MKFKIIFSILIIVILASSFSHKAEALSCAQTFPVVGTINTITKNEFYSEILLDNVYNFDPSDFTADRGSADGNVSLQKMCLHRHYNTRRRTSSNGTKEEIEFIWFRRNKEMYEKNAMIKEWKHLIGEKVPKVKFQQANIYYLFSSNLLNFVVNVRLTQNSKIFFRNVARKFTSQLKYVSEIPLCLAEDHV
jgi:hypothetical protein